MRWMFRAGICAGLFVLAADVLAIPAEKLKENYQPIIVRNPFGLKPPPPPVVAPPTNQAAPPKPKTDIFLLGITSVGYPRLPKQVFLKTQEQGKKEPTLYSLTEGVEKDGIKVLNIDEVNKKVRIQMDNTETLLSFQTHGVTPPAAPAPAAGVPGAPPAPGVPGQPLPVPPPGAQPGAGQAAYNPAQPAGQPYQPQPVIYGQNQTMAGITPNRTIPTRRVRSAEPVFNSGAGAPPMGGNPYGQTPQPQQPLDPAEQYLRMHLDKTVGEKQGIPMPPVPPVN